MARDTLFAAKSILDVHRERRQRMYEEIEGYTKNDLLNANIEDLCSYFCGKYGFENVELFPDQVEVSDDETVLDLRDDPLRRHYISHLTDTKIKALRITFSIPLSGDGNLLNYLPSEFFLGGVHGRVQGQEVLLECKPRSTSPERAYGRPK